MFKLIFIVSVGIVGFVEWLKNFLPEKLKESKFGVPVISGLISAAIGAGTCFVVSGGFGVREAIIYIGGTIGLVQVSYNVLLQTFKAVVAKLKQRGVSIKEAIDGSAIDADEIVDAIEEKVSEAVKKALEGKK